jgi:hypothetical protein
VREREKERASEFSEAHTRAKKKVLKHQRIRAGFSSLTPGWSDSIAGKAGDNDCARKKRSEIRVVRKIFCYLAVKIFYEIIKPFRLTVGADAAPKLFSQQIPERVRNVKRENIVVRGAAAS